MERAAGGTLDAVFQPSDATEPAGFGGMQVALSCPFALGILYMSMGVLSRGATAETPKKTRCTSLWLPSPRCGKQERLLHAQTRWDSEAERTWTLSGLDWTKVDPGRGHSFARPLHEK